MRRTLILLPHEIASIPLFGFGWILGLVLVSALAVTIYLRSRGLRPIDYWMSNGLMWGIVAGVATFVMPNIELVSTPTPAAPMAQPVGMAIRGYGVMLLLGVASSITLAVVRGRRYGVGDNVMFGIAPWLLVGGIVGARLFYVVEYRDKFFTGEIGSTIRNLINFTEGGLVVYGGFIAGFLGGVFYLRRHRLPFLLIGDVIVPCLFIGLCLGRLGCLMNGCCYGNACDDHWTALRFPSGSPVYQEQLASGELIGIKMDPAESVVELVTPDSLASNSGIKAGDKIGKVDVVLSIEEADPAKPAEDAPLGMLAVIDGKEHYWPASKLPLFANPVRPSQVLSSLGGLVLCLSLCLFSRYSNRNGVTMMVGFASYAVLRFGEELLRNDEPGQFGTTLTIAQWVSILVFSLSIAALIWLQFRESVRAEDRPSL